MPGDNLPQWAVRFLVGGSSAMGAGLLGVLVWVVLGVFGRVETVENEQWAEKLKARAFEGRVEQQLQQMASDNAKARKLLEKLAERQGIIVTE